MRIQLMPGARMLWIVTMKLIAPTSDESAARCSERVERPCAVQGEEAAGGEEDERRADVEQADALVVDSRDPRRDAPAAPVGAIGLRSNRHSRIPCRCCDADTCRGLRTACRSSRAQRAACSST